jgi:hypothetical protein
MEELTGVPVVSGAGVVLGVPVPVGVAAGIWTQVLVALLDPLQLERLTTDISYIAPGIAFEYIIWGASCIAWYTTFVALACLVTVTS